MKQFKFFSLICVTAMLLCTMNFETKAQTKQQLQVSLTFKRSKTYASNQFAIWIENAKGKIIRTVYATRFTAKGGYETRKQSLPLWVSKSKVAQMNAKQVDAFTGATPTTNGTYTYTWDGKDDNGKTVAPGNYTVYVEGTLYQENKVIFSGKFKVNAKKQTIKMIPQFTVKDDTNRDMLTSVRAIYLP